MYIGCLQGTGVSKRTVNADLEGSGHPFAAPSEVRTVLIVVQEVPRSAAATSTVPVVIKPRPVVPPQLYAHKSPPGGSRQHLLCNEPTNLLHCAPRFYGLRSDGHPPADESACVVLCGAVEERTAFVCLQRSFEGAQQAWSQI